MPITTSSKTEHYGFKVQQHEAHRELNKQGAFNQGSAGLLKIIGHFGILDERDSVRFDTLVWQKLNFQHHIRHTLAVETIRTRSNMPFEITGALQDHLLELAAEDQEKLSKHERLILWRGLHNAARAN